MATQHWPPQLGANFHYLVDNLIATGALMVPTLVSGVSGASGRAWQVPPPGDGVDGTGATDEVPYWFGDPTDSVGEVDGAGAQEAFRRGWLNQCYAETLANGATSNSGRVGETMTVRQAVDYVAAMERAFHARHAGPVRCRMWAAARRQGHGAATGPFASMVRTFEERLSGSASDLNG